MLPLRDVIPSRTTPWVTLSLIAVSALVFAGITLIQGTHDPEILSRLGIAGDRRSWAAGMVSLFLHGGLLHLAGNVAALWLFGENVEDQLGHGRFLAFYLAAGCLGTFTAWWAAGDVVPLAGASGATAGVVGAYLVLFPRSRLLVAVPTSWPFDLVEAPALPFAAGWFIWQFAVNPGMLNGAVLPTLFVGTTVGAVSGWLLPRPERRQVTWWAP